MCNEFAQNVAIVSLGCPKNLVDSEKMLAELAEGGMIVGAPMDQADVIVINTCGFLAAARAESLEVVAEAVECKLSGRARRVVVAGCMATRDREALFELAPGIDAVVGVANRDDILSAVAADEQFCRTEPCGGGAVVSDAGRFRLTPRHTAYLRISEGCSRGCTYCTIPAIRGPLRSKSTEAVLAEARELIADGAVELNIIAQDTTAYGSDLSGPSDANLASLLRQLDALGGARWIRLLYTYPRRFTDELMAAIAGCPHVLPYVDMPLQHISTGVLKRMGRAAGRGEIDVQDLLHRMRERIDGLTLRTTLIVGFPGESDEQFEELLAFVKEFRFDALGVFEFSPEEGTPAASMAHQVPPAVKTQRAEAIMLAQQEIAFAANASRVGERAEILVDGMGSGGYCIGRTCEQAPDIDSVCILTEPRADGAFAACEVTDWQDYDLVVKPL